MTTGTGRKVLGVRYECTVTQTMIDFQGHNGLEPYNFRRHQSNTEATCKIYRCMLRTPSPYGRYLSMGFSLFQRIFVNIAIRNHKHCTKIYLIQIKSLLELTCHTQRSLENGSKFCHTQLSAINFTGPLQSSQVTTLIHAIFRFICITQGWNCQELHTRTCCFIYAFKQAVEHE